MAKRETKTLELKTLGKVEIMELTVGDVLSIRNMSEDQQIIRLVQKALVNPKMTEKEIIGLPMKCFEDLSVIVAEATGQNDTE